MLKIAIDSGQSGAIVLSQKGKVWTYNCPATQAEVIDLVTSVAGLARGDGVEISAVIEKVHSMPGMNCAALWKFSANYATWQCALIANKIPFKEVPPQQWMKALGNLPKEKKARKNCIKDQMQKRFPDLKVTLANADALALLSVWDKL